MNFGKVAKGFKYLSISIIAVKLLGFLYKLPLANILGSEGLGVYQIVFPIYSLILTVTSSAIPSTIAKKSREKGFLSKAESYVTTAGVLGMIFLAALSYPISQLLNSPKAWPLFVIISPSVFFVAKGAIYRGFSQGKMDFSFTAISEILGQFSKIMLGIAVLFIFKSDIYLATTLSVLVVTISKFITFLYLRRNKFALKNEISIENSLIKSEFNNSEKEIVKREQRTPLKEEFSPIYKREEKNKGKKQYNSGVFVAALPMIISFSVLPITMFLESGIITNFLQNDGVKMYGLYSGVCLALANIPISFISSLGVVYIPMVAKGDCLIGIKKGFAATILITLPFAIAFFLLNNEIISIAFYNISISDKEIASQLIKCAALIPLFEGLTVFSASILHGMNKGKIPMTAAIIGGITKIVFLIFALKINNSIIYAVFATLLQYLVAGSVNLIYIIVKRKNNILPKNFFKLLLYGVVLFFGIFAIKSSFGGLIATILSVVFSGIMLVLFALSFELLKFKKISRKRNAN